MSENLLDQIDGWRKKHDRNFTIGRLNRFVQASTAEHQILTKRNPKDVIPQIPDEIKKRFTQDDSSNEVSKRLSKSVVNKSNIENEISTKSNFSKRKSSPVSDLDKIEEIHESNGSYAKKLRSSSTSINNNSNRAFNDKSNQMEKSRRDDFETNLLSNHSRILQNISSNSNNKNLNSTAIAPSTQSKKANIPITPIPQFGRKNMLINSPDDDDEFENADQNFENDLGKFLKPQHSSTANNTQQIFESNKKISSNKIKSKTSIFESKKSLDFTSSGLPEHKRISNIISEDNPRNLSKPKTSDKSEYDNFEHQDTKNKSKSINKTKKLTLKKNSDSDEDSINKDDSFITSKKTTNKLVATRKDPSHRESPVSIKKKLLQKSQLSSKDSLNNSNKTLNVSEEKDLSKFKVKDVSVTASNKTQNKPVSFREEPSHLESSNTNKIALNSKIDLNKTKEKDLNKSKKNDEIMNIVNKSTNKPVSIREESIQSESLVSDKNNSSYQDKDSNKSNELITNDLSDESTKLKKNESMTTINRTTNRPVSIREESSNLESKEKELTISQKKNESMTTINKSRNRSVSIQEENPVQSASNQTKPSYDEEKDSNNSEKDISNLINQSDKNLTKKSKDSIVMKNDSNLEISSDSEIDEPAKKTSNEPTHIPKLITKSSITIVRLPKINTNVTETEERNEQIRHEKDNMKRVDPLDNIIDLTVPKKSKISKLVNSSNKDASLNQSESELISNNENIYLKKSFLKSINLTSSISNISTRSTSYSKKTVTELKTPFLTNKKLPPVPNDFSKINQSNESKTANEPLNADKNLLQNDKNSNDNESEQFAFSNIEPADMFSPSKTLEIQNEISKVKPTTSSDIVKKSTKNVEINKKNKKSKEKEDIISNDESDQENEKENISSRNKKKNKTKSQKEIKESKALKTISNTPKESNPISPIKLSQRNNKNLNIRRKTIIQLSPLPEYDDEGLRRSKRIKLDSASVPIYEWEQITDYTGKKVFVQSIVAATKRTCRLIDLWEDLESKKHNKKKTSSSRIRRPADDLSSEEEQSIDEQPEPKNNKKTSKTDDNNEIEFGDLQSNQTSQREQIHVKMNLNTTNSTETSLSIQTTQNFNESQESIIFEDDESSVGTKKHIFCFTKNLESIAFKECYPGVSLKAISESNGYICIDPMSSTKTQIHRDGCEYHLQKGNCFLSINGQLSKHTNSDIFIIPDEISYKIKNISETEKAYLYFRFY